MSEKSDTFKLVNAVELAKEARVGLELTYFDVIELMGELKSLKEYIAELEGCVEELKKRIVELNWADRPALVGELKSRIAELSQTVGLITTLKPTMVMDVDHPLEMAKEVVEHVTTRIAELEAAQRWIPVSERLPEDGKPVWVCTIWNEQHSGFLIDGVWGGLFRDFREGEVTYWMSLPELPEESKKW